MMWSICKVAGITVQEYLQSSIVVVLVVRYESQIVEKPYFKARESGQTASKHLG